MTENTCLEGIGLIFRKLLTCGLKDGIKNFCFLIVTSHGLPLAQS
jgi:hypothetical protein